MDQPKSKKNVQRPNDVCVVTAGSPYGWIICNALIDRFGPITVIREQPESMKAFLKRRAKKVGWISVVGQAVTMAYGKLGKKAASSQIAAIEREEGLLTSPAADQILVDVPSINAPEFTAAIAELKPKVILLVGTRMMKADVIAAMPCPVLNYHAGINPQYRGMNGGYWALATGDKGNFGGTVHLVDAGVDTGSVLYQARGEPAGSDTILTYAHRLAAISRSICCEAVGDALNGTLKPLQINAPSRQWYHPPIWSYICTGIRKGVW
jgi:methionyl-tRNA formyltransferase